MYLPNFLINMFHSTSSHVETQALLDETLGSYLLQD